MGEWSGADDRSPPRWFRRHAVADRCLGRRHRPRLRHPLLRAFCPGSRPSGRAVGPVRRVDARPRPSESRHLPLRMLGTDVGHVVPAHWQPAHRVAGPRRRAARAARDQRRRPRPARRHGDPRPGNGHLPAQRDPGRPARRERGGNRRHRARSRRSLHEVGAVSLPRVAARRHGRADARERLSALGDHGHGRRVPDRPAGPGVRVRGLLAAARAHGGLRDAAVRRSARPSSARPEAAPRVRHRQPARLHGDPVRSRHTGCDDRGVDAPRRPRRVQVRALHGRGRHRPPDGNPRPSRSCPRCPAAGSGSTW